MNITSGLKIGDVGKSGTVTVVGVIGDDDVAFSDPALCSLSVRFNNISTCTASRLNPDIQGHFTMPGVIFRTVLENADPPHTSWVQQGTLTNWLEFIAANVSPEQEDDTVYADEMVDLVGVVNGFTAGVFPRHYADFAERVLKMPEEITQQYRELADILDGERAARAASQATAPAAEEKQANPTEGMTRAEVLRWAATKADSEEEAARALASLEDDDDEEVNDPVPAAPPTLDMTKEAAP